ncbi:DNA replication and repair protein RecF [Leptotrichia trevisanii]|uniref:DNA replication and repair protein RecF n=1 Tax=Leptotrichia trevisanii TaxID=109328 RepID=A0A510KNR4_9FUSO|nr:AAA family ATPase [Leptotrichia trevisanii]BBM51475.1 DNA replication and repair protein RecF [Leptotrichia trevisanii]
MFLSKLKIRNFRKYKELEVSFKQGLNVLIGENDGGKTTIIDAIRILLGTQSQEYYRIDEKDFNDKNLELEIECIFKFQDKSEKKVAKFLEWITFDNEDKPILIVRLRAYIKDFMIKKEITAGESGTDSRFYLTDELRATYLKPLRDADKELISGRYSRLSQILKNHKLFLGKEKEHEFIDIMKEFNLQINKYFSKNGDGKEVISTIDKHLSNFLGKEKNDDYKTNINITENNLFSILNSLNLKLSENKIGLGTLNQLYMALELLLFETEGNILNLCLIEELEAHLHPQAQLRTIKHFQNKNNENNQIILTTHSITLASSVKLENLILCKNNKIYSMGAEYTKLEEHDYKFLEMFLDATKANLFFAKGVILVEGTAENILIPTIAEIIGKPLHEYGVSVVNVGNIAFLRYSKIFLRKNKEEKLKIPVAIITDLDIKNDHNCEGIVLKNENFILLSEFLKNRFNKDLSPLQDKVFFTKEELKSELKEFLDLKKYPVDLKDLIKNKIKKENIDINEYRKLRREKKINEYSMDNVQAFVNKKQTLEYDLLLGNLCEKFYRAILLTKKKNDNEIDKEIKRIKNLDSENRAKKIFKENFYSNYEKNQKSKLSKAEVALNFSYILKNEESKKIRNEIVKDEYFRYIVEAIEYVTERDNNNVGG